METDPGRTIIGLGEILWDLLPDGRKLGGAPANFAYHASVLGDRGIAVSRVGRDPLGEEILRRLADQGQVRDALQVDPDHPTGTVEVSLDSGGQPSYRITPQVAWDYLSWTADLERLAGEADAVCFGSLAQRFPVSRETIHRFLAAMRPANAERPANGRRSGALRIFDINLRQSWYDREVIDRSLQAADILKLNHEELPLVFDVLGRPRPDTPKEGCRELRRIYDLRLVCLTRGRHGSLLVTDDGAEDHPGLPVRVIDTVGAGDAFTAVLAHHLLRGSDLGTIARAANRYGSWVATQAGATPFPPSELLAEIT